ncbi:MAG: molybdopterin-dependent oxidoreductase [Acidilobaceae archaeon]|nr:molybdopterin-dependent oxidoreductase [Acidilobaceae archaeon]MCX8165573.1 molybdopterin-dependent oxidoreductase [Acidilobaceae archaeon]MDW7974000.1 molybdopterin-dependent oxidoreductase [Sulfolobales archaeon]
MAEIDLPLVFECTGDKEVLQPQDAVGVAFEAKGVLEELLDMKAEAYLAHWEYSGERFNLYAFELRSLGMQVGQLRVVESGDVMINVSGVLFSSSKDHISRSAWEELVEGGRVSTGYNMGITYLKSSGTTWPAGQRAAKRFVIYAAEGVQQVDGSRWSLKVRGLVERELSLSLEEVSRRSSTFRDRDFHCVTGWSVKGNSWQGVRLVDLAESSKVSSEARWVIAKSVKGYSTVLPLEDALNENTIVAVGLNGSPLSTEGGFPARLVVPHLYGWKSAKWLSELIFVKDYVDGYWEALAYHERGLAEAEERFKIRNPLVAESGLGNKSPPKRPSNF